MSTLREEIVDALEFLENENLDESGETKKLILPSGAELPCIPSREEVGYEIQIGPQIRTVTVSVKVRKSHFVTADNTIITVDSDIILADNSTPRPRAGEGNYRRVGFRGTINLRVLRVDEDSTGAFFVILMGEK